jgi:hypothetical protein
MVTAPQILPDDPDLFVFDEEVVGVLETLVGKTLEQGLIEVSQKMIFFLNWPMPLFLFFQYTNNAY